MGPGGHLQPCMQAHAGLSSTPQAEEAATATSGCPGASIPHALWPRRDDPEVGEAASHPVLVLVRVLAAGRDHPA